MNNATVTIDTSIPNLPEANPSEIDPKKWPLMEAPESSNEPWWHGLGDDGREEYAAAMDDVQSAVLKEDGSLLTPSRVFRFWTREKRYRPHLTRLDWTAPNGKTYAFTYEPDKRLRDLAEKDPLSAALEMSRRFAICATDPKADYTNVDRLLHAATIRHAFLPNTGGYKQDAVAQVDPWTGNFEIFGEGHEAVPTKFPATRQFNMSSTMLEGPPADKELLMDPDAMFGSIGYGAPFECMTRDQMTRLASEANAILQSTGIPLIEPRDVIEMTKHMRPYHPAIDQLNEFLTGKPVYFDDPFGMSVYIRNEHDNDVQAALNDLATTKAVSEGLITTETSKYRIAVEPDYEQDIEISKISDDENSEPDILFSFYRGFVAEAEKTEASMIHFFQNLHHHYSSNLSQQQIGAAVHVCKILTLATNELLMARHAETSFGQIEFCACAKSTLSGEIKVCLQDYGRVHVLDVLQYAAPFIHDFDGELRGVYTAYSELYHDEHISGMAAENLRESAMAVFQNFGLDSSKIEAGIDEFFGFSAA